jgi:maltose O-acetyltransferase
MLSGELYSALDPELEADNRRAELLLQQYNATLSEHGETRRRLLSELLGSVGEGTMVKPPFACDYGYNIRIGRNGFVNYNCVFLDCALIEIGDNLQMGPAVQLYTAGHPVDPEARRTGLEFAKPIRIGSDVWIGGGAVILPGVSVGDGSVVGAGSVVTRDVPPLSVVAGNPARAVRRVSPGGRETALP